MRGPEGESSAVSPEIVEPTILPLAVEVHPPNTLVNMEPFRIDPYIKRISWSDSVTAPYGGASITLKVPRSATSMSQNLPRPGEWLIIRKDRLGPALWFGFINRITSGVQGGPSIRAIEYQIECENWFQFLHRCQMYVFPGVAKDAERARRSGSDLGTLFSVQQWAQMFAAFDGMGTAGSEVDKFPGEILSRILRIIARVRLPATLMSSGGGVNLARIINVVYDKESAAKVCGKPKDPSGHDYINNEPGPAKLGAAVRTVDPLVGFSINSLQSMNPVSGTSVLDFINGTFGADSYMMEMFPSLEDFPEDSVEEKGVQSDARSRFGDLSEEEQINQINRFMRVFSTTESKARELLLLGSKGLEADFPSQVSGFLQRSLVLHYRMRPWRTEPVWAYAKHRVGRFNASNVHEAVDRDVSKKVFTEVTWKPSEAVIVPSDQVISYQYSREDAQRANVFTTSLPMSGNQALAFDELGLPVFSLKDLINQGARFNNVNWPFFLLPERDRGKKPKENFFQYIRAVAYQACMWTFNNERFMNGTVTMAYRPDVRHGECFWFGVGPGVFGPGIFVDGRTKAFIKDINDPKAVSETPKEKDKGFAPFDSENSYICAYADTVTHSFDVMPNGSVKMRTTVTFQRGLYNNIGRTSPVLDPDSNKFLGLVP